MNESVFPDCCSSHDYMALCLHDLRRGYYRNQNPIGLSGDFTTAPEISPFFGECIAFWVVQQWEHFGCPSQWMLVEWGPGRGTFIADMLRVLRKVPDLYQGLSLLLWEVNPFLRAQQQEALHHFEGSVSWVGEPDMVRFSIPFVIVGNEFLDVLPVRTLRFQAGAWEEQYIQDGKQIWKLLVGDAPVPSFETPWEGSIWEYAPLMKTYLDPWCERIQRGDGVALFLDYGYEQPFIPESTIQALYRHERVDPFSHPGAYDVTAHVNFYHVRQCAQSAGCRVTLSTQRQFLKDWGIDVRLHQCIVTHPDRKTDIQKGYDRLIYDMGNLVKACIIGS